MQEDVFVLLHVKNSVRLTECQYRLHLITMKDRQYILESYEEKPKKNIIIKHRGTETNHAFHRGRSLCFSFSSCFLLLCTGGRKQKVCCDASIPHYDPLSSSITQCSMDHLITQLFRPGPSPHSRHSSRARARGYKEIFNYTEAPT